MKKLSLIPTALPKLVECYCKHSYKTALLEETGEGIDVSYQMVIAADSTHC